MQIFFPDTILEPFPFLVLRWDFIKERFQEKKKENTVSRKKVRLKKGKKENTLSIKEKSKI